MKKIINVALIGLILAPIPGLASPAANSKAFFAGLESDLRNNPKGYSFVKHNIWYVLDVGLQYCVDRRVLTVNRINQIRSDYFAENNTEPAIRQTLIAIDANAERHLCPED